MQTESFAELTAEICRLAKGPARPVLEEAIWEWLEGHKLALRDGRSPHLPYPADQSDPFSPDPKQPLPMPNFGEGCVVLAAVHDRSCDRCVALWPAPIAEDDPVGYAVWKLLREKASKTPNPSYVRKILNDVRRGLQLRGVELPAVDKPSQSEGPDETHAGILREEVSVGAEMIQITGAESEAPEKSANFDQAAIRLMNVYTNGLADERLKKAATILDNNKLTADEKLWEIDNLMPIPPTISGEKLGKLLGISKTAVQRTQWYKQKRKGQKDEKIDGRRERHHQRSQQYEFNRKTDNDD